MSRYAEKQLTFDPRGHQLTNINIWTPDSEWLAYDVRPSGASFTTFLKVFESMILEFVFDN